MSRTSIPLLIAIVTMAFACSDQATDPLERMQKRIAETTSAADHDADLLMVRHILISFNGAPKTESTRTLVEAEKFAAELFAQIEDGADFDSLMKKHSDDPGPGVYPMSADRVPPTPGVTQRTGMVKSFGDVAWRLDVGETSVAPHHEKDSPFGWHIIQRTE